MMEHKKYKAVPPRKKIQWSQIIAILAILAGFVIVQECLFLMYICIKDGYTPTAAWLTAAVGVGEAVIIAGANAYISLCKSDHKSGGITFEAAKAKGFVEVAAPTPINQDSPAI